MGSREASEDVTTEPGVEGWLELGCEAGGGRDEEEVGIDGRGAAEWRGRSVGKRTSEKRSPNG